MIPEFKNAWCLTKTNEIKPLGYIGYEFTLYDKDDITIIKKIRAKTASKIWEKIIRLMREEMKKRGTTI